MSLSPQEKSQNRRTALILVSVVAVFFAGIVVRYWFFGH